MSSNPILFEGIFPPFKEISPTTLFPSIDALLTSSLEKVDNLLKQDPSRFNELVLPLEQIDDRLSRSWSVLSHLQSVKSEPAIREAYEACLPKLTEYSTKMGQNKALFAAFDRIQTSAEFSTLSTEEKTLVEHAIRDFKLSGVALEGDEKAQYAALSTELSQLSNTYSNYCMDATDHWHWHTEEAKNVQGIPEAVLHAAQLNAEENKLKGWRFGLDFPTYLAVITYAEDSSVRKIFYDAFVTRASDQGPDAGKWDNGPIMKDILKKRQQLAKLLGFESYAEYSLATKMAQSTKEVLSFYDSLIAKAKPAAEKEFETLQAYANEKGLEGSLQPWDISFYSERLKHERYSISQEALREYFPLEKVLAGLFEITTRLYGVKISNYDSVQVWDDTVKCYQISDDNDEPLAYFYLDPFARKAKRSGAWMDECASRFMDKQLQLPVAYLVTNFRPPAHEKPALLTHDDVITLFHEFGHGLHHMLTKGQYPSLSGINGVPWDAVELPSQFFENWCWEPEALKLISAHIETQEPLDAALIEKLRESKNYGAGMAMVRQVELGLFDFTIHMKNADENIHEILESVRDRVSVTPRVEYNRFENAFTHIFSGGYSAGYYSYLWAEVLSADAFSAFQETGIFDKNTGQRFKNCILEKGGSEPPSKLFEDFRGRAPSIEPLLKQEGLVA